MGNVTEEHVESMLESKEQAKKMIDGSDAFLLVAVTGMDIHSSRGYYHNRDKMVLSGAVNLVTQTMALETITGTEMAFVRKEAVQ